MIKISAKPVFVPLLPTAEPTNFFYVLSFFHHVKNKKCSYSSDHSCLSSFMKHFVIVYVSAVQSHFWRIWKLVFNVLFVAPCARANIFVTEKLSQKICSCGCGFRNRAEIAQLESKEIYFAEPRSVLFKIIYNSMKRFSPVFCCCWPKLGLAFVVFYLV